MHTDAVAPGPAGAGARRPAGHRRHRPGGVPAGGGARRAWSAGVAVVAELTFLPGRAALAGYDVMSLVTYDERGGGGMRGLIGVDIGGSGIKAGVVDSRRGVLIGERVRVPTPQPATPEAVVAATAELVAVARRRRRARSASACPGPIVGGRVLMMANLDASWVGEPAAGAVHAPRSGGPCVVLNDADAAGVAEMRFGAGRGVRGSVLLLTLGTGIGVGAVRRRRPGAEPGARPHRDPGQGRRAARLGGRPGAQGPVLRGVGAAARRVPRPPSTS